eukprot:3371530-Rhodomonas_salina.1
MHPTLSSSSDAITPVFSRQTLAPQPSSHTISTNISTQHRKAREGRERAVPVGRQEDDERELEELQSTHADLFGSQRDAAERGRERGMHRHTDTQTHRHTDTETQRHASVSSVVAARLSQLSDVRDGNNEQQQQTHLFQHMEPSAHLKIGLDPAEIGQEPVQARDHPRQRPQPPDPQPSGHHARRDRAPEGGGHEVVDEGREEAHGEVFADAEGEDAGKGRDVVLLVLVGVRGDGDAEHEDDVDDDEGVADHVPEHHAKVPGRAEREPERKRPELERERQHHEDQPPLRKRRVRVDRLQPLARAPLARELEVHVSQAAAQLAMLLRLSVFGQENRLGRQPDGSLCQRTRPLLEQCLRASQQHRHYTFFVAVLRQRVRGEGAWGWGCWGCTIGFGLRLFTFRSHPPI